MLLIQFSHKLLFCSSQHVLFRHNDAAHRSPPSLLEVKRKDGGNKQNRYKEDDIIKDYRNSDRHKDREDELYEVISELLMERRKKRKKRKRLKLFEIIDRIPVTSSESESEDDTLYRKKTPHKQTSNIPIGLPFLPSGYNSLPFLPSGYNSHTVITKPDHELDISSGLPKPPVRESKPRLDRYKPVISPTVTQTKPLLDQYKPKMSTFLNNTDIDPLSWANIIKEARCETRHTQTDKNILVQTKEIQTELKEMIEIPRSQTFFTSETNNVTETNEFCKRVREEVLEKLENINKEVERKTYLINAAVQTNIIAENVEVVSQNINVEVIPPKAYVEERFDRMQQKDVNIEEQVCSDFLK